MRNIFLFRNIAVTLFALMLAPIAVAQDPGFVKSATEVFDVYLDMCDEDQQVTGCMDDGYQCRHLKKKASKKQLRNREHQVGYMARGRCMRTSNSCKNFFAETCCAAQCVSIKKTPDIDAVSKCLQVCLKGF